MNTQPNIHNKKTKNISIREATIIWAKIGLLSFGGPAAQIALMHQFIVDKRQWLSEKEYLNALSFCMLLPGPEAMQLATYAGWKLHGKLGGFIAGILFVLPGALVILSLAITYVMIGNIPIIQVIFLGVKAAVLVVVIESLLRLSKKAITTYSLKTIAILTFIAIFFLEISFPLIILLAAIFGYFRAQHATERQIIKLPKNNGRNLLFTLIGMLVVWWLPLILIDYFFNELTILTQIGTFFSRLAVVTFGGAYAVLAYMGQDVVNQWGWLSAGEMLDGLGLAETTPGPLILVTEFVGFIAAYREGGLSLGIAGAAITLWMTFVPCFLWIFVGAPYIEWICAQPKLKGALEAISAAVVGVILNLSIWFALHVLFHSVTSLKFGVVTLWVPELSSIDWKVLFLTLLCALLSFKYHWSIIKTLLISSLLAAVSILFSA